ncbi:MAG: HAMP domain-containing sensor histidine kinase, partial [Microvirga sp.]
VAGAVYASRTPDNVVRLIYGERGKIGVALVSALAAIIAVAFVFTRGISRPIEALMVRAAALGRGTAIPSEPGARYGTREIAALARSLDALAEQLRQRSDYVATFANHVSHELKTPLTAIQGAAELLRDEEDVASSDPADKHATTMSAGDRQRFLDNIIADTQRLGALLRRLRELARAETAGTDGQTTLRAIAAALQDRFPGLAIHADGARDRILSLSQEDAGIVFGHLADNALQHGAKTIQLTVVAAGEGARMTVADDGPGLLGRDHERVFEPFYTTRREGGGTGMGLSIVRALLQGRGGSIVVASAEQGTAFDIDLPLADIGGNGRSKSGSGKQF